MCSIAIVHYCAGTTMHHAASACNNHNDPTVVWGAQHTVGGRVPELRDRAHVCTTCLYTVYHMWLS